METIFAQAAPTVERPSGHELMQPGRYPGHALCANNHQEADQLSSPTLQDDDGTSPLQHTIGRQ